MLRLKQLLANLPQEATPSFQRPASPPSPAPAPLPTVVPPSPTRDAEARATPTLGPSKRPSADWVGQLEGQVHALVNDERKKAGIKVLTLDQKLSDLARSHSSDMAINNYFEHENLRGQSPSSRATNAAYGCRKDYGSYYTEGIAENIFQTWLHSSTTYMYGLPVGKDYMSVGQLAQQIVDGWMNSRGHRQNILELKYDKQGVGVAVSKDEKVYVTQDFC